MWAWLLNPKNLLLVVVSALCVGLLTVSLWYRGSYAHSVSEAKIAKAQAQELTAQVQEYKRDMALMQLHQARMQEIEASSGSLQTAVDGLPKRDLTNDEKRVAADITGFIINGVLPKTGSSQVLPAPGKADTAKPGNDPGPVK